MKPFNSGEKKSSGSLKNVLYKICLEIISNIYVHNRLIGPGDMGSIPGRVIPKTLKMVLDTSFQIKKE